MDKIFQKEVDFESHIYCDRRARFSFNFTKESVSVKDIAENLVMFYADGDDYHQIMAGLQKMLDEYSKRKSNENY